MNPAEEYILNKAEPFKSILLYLQAFIEKTIPGLELKYKYKIPFYYVEGKPYCYLNQAQDYVDLGFWKAAHLSVHLEHMVSAGRKMMRSLRYKSLEDIDESILLEVLQDAYNVRGNKFWS